MVAGELEVDELGHDSLGTVQLFLTFDEAEVQVKAAPRRAPILREPRADGSPGGQLVARMYSIFVGSSLKPLSSQSSLEASDEALNGLMGDSDCSTVEDESCPVQGAAGLSLRWSICDGPVKAKGEEQWAQRVVLMYSPFARDLFPGRTKLSCEHAGHNTWPSPVPLVGFPEEDGTDQVG